jgi:hypothetical protein
MQYVVKKACSFFLDHEKKTEGDIVGPLTAKALKRVMHLVEPFDGDDDEADAPETPAAPAVEPERAVEGDDTPEASPAPKRRRRAAVKADG